MLSIRVNELFEPIVLPKNNNNNNNNKNKQTKTNKQKTDFFFFLLKSIFWRYRSLSNAR